MIISKMLRSASRLKLDPPPSVRGKRILITGGSVGLGAVLARAFLKEGARVATCARSEEALGPIRKEGALALAADVSRPEDVATLMDLIRREWGGLDAVVNNAAVLGEGALLSQSLEDFRRTLEIDLSGPLIVTRAAAGSMERGSVVNITSGLSRVPMAPFHAYCVAKAGLDMLTRCLAAEFEGRLSVNALDPGVARTRMNPLAAHPPEAVIPALRALACLGPEGPTGRCFKKDGSLLPWG